MCSEITQPEIPTYAHHSIGKFSVVSSEEAPPTRRSVVLEAGSLVETSSRGILSPAVIGTGDDTNPAVETTPTVSVQGVGVAERRSSEAVVAVSGGPSTSQPTRIPSSASEREKGVVVDDYESESDINPEDMRMFEEGYTRTVV